MAHSKSHYIKIWAYLCGLLVVSVLGPEIAKSIGNKNAALILVLVTAFGIAIVKAYMVIVEFMHLPLDKKFCTYLLVTCMAFMLLFFAFVAPDIMNHEGRNWVNTAAKQEVQCVQLAESKHTDIDKAKCKALPFKRVVELSKLDKAAKSGKAAPKGPAPKTPKTHKK